MEGAQAKHARSMADERLRRQERNRQLLELAIAGGCPEGAPRQQGALSLVLERFVVPEDEPRIVAFEGMRGVQALLAALCEQSYAGIWQEGRLTGVAGSLQLDEPADAIDVRATVGAGAQLALEVGPADDIAILLAAIGAFDRHVHLAARALGARYRLLAQGYHPAATSPSDVVVVPTAAYTLMNAHLARRGPSAFDLMRCTAATKVLLPMCGEVARDALRYRIACALAPLLAFLTDNCLRLRGCDPSETPRMARALVVAHADPLRGGLVPGSLGPDFGYQDYERWVEGITPGYVTNAQGVSFSTGDSSCLDLLQEREMAECEAAELLGHVWPWARWDGRLCLQAADALPPRLAASYAALVKGLLSSDDGCRQTSELLGLDTLDDRGVTSLWQALQVGGWDARAFGRPVPHLVHELVALASRNLPLYEERRLLDELAQLWEVGMAPRDTLLHAWEHRSVRTPEQEAAARWGEGAVTPYEQLEGEPPSGSTGVLPLNKLHRAGGRRL